MKPISPHAFAALVQGAHDVGANAHDWALAIYEESGWDPSIQNSRGAPYYGLNQSNREAARSAGYTGDFPAGWQALSTDAQLPFVIRFFRQKVATIPATRHSAAHILASNFLPARVHKNAPRDDIDYALCRAGERDAKGNLLRFYEDNDHYDADRKGTITIRDLSRFMAERIVLRNPRDMATLRNGVNAAYATLGFQGPPAPTLPGVGSHLLARLASAGIVIAVVGIALYFAGPPLAARFGWSL